MNWLKTTTLAFGAMALTPIAALADNGDTLKTVQARGTLNCPGDIGSYLGFAEVDDKGVWKGIDIGVCCRMGLNPTLRADFGLPLAGFCKLSALRRRRVRQDR